MGRTLTRIVLYPVLAIALAWTTWDYIETRRLDRAIRKVDASLRTASPPAGRVPGGGAIEPRQMPSIGPDACRMYVAAAQLVSVPSERLSELREMADRWGPAQRAEAERLVEIHAPAFVLLREARSLPLDPVWVRIRGIREAIGGLATLHQLNDLRIRLLSQPSHADDAVQALLDEVAVLRAYDDDLLARLVRTGRERGIVTSLAALLGAVRVSEGSLAALERAFDEQSAPDWAERTVLDDRAVYLRTLRPRWRLMDQVTRPLRSHEAVRTLDGYTEALRFARAPWSERIAAGEQARIPGRGGRLYDAFSRAPSVDSIARFSHALAQVLTQRRAALVALSVERFRLVHGHPPASLAELTPLVKEPVGSTSRAELVDPIDGAPWVYRREDDGYVIQSTREDRSSAAARERGSYAAPRPQTVPQPEWGVRVAVTTLLAKPGAGAVPAPPPKGR